jgi:hypothetical protein
MKATTPAARVSPTPSSQSERNRVVMALISEPA